MALHESFLANRALIEQIIRSLCLRHRLFSVEGEDFASAVRIRLMEDDDAILRRFEGRSALKTYLAAVITHLYQDWRNARWGKWRPSMEAKRGGPLAVRLECLLVRDGLTIEEAYETLRTNLNVAESREAIDAMSAKFPGRTRRQFVSEEPLETLPTGEISPEQLLMDRESDSAARSASNALTAALKALPAQDRLILKMRFHSGLSVADISRALHLDQKALYRRLDRLLSALREALADAGCTAEAASQALEYGGFSRLEHELEAWETSGEGRPINGGEDSPVQTSRTP